MAAPLVRRSGWTALALSSAARGVLGLLGTLVVWAVLPAVAGWHPTAVMTGSMLPRLVPGDVVASRPVPVDEVRPQQVLLFADPDHPGRLRLHRLVRTDADGRLVTRGDANAGDDSTPVAPLAVRGVAAVRVPFVARPVVWAHDGDVRALAALAAALGTLGLLAAWFRPAADGDPDGDPTDGADPAERGDRSSARHRPGVTRAGRLLTTTGAVAVAGLVCATTAVAAPFGSSTVDPASSFRASAYFTCAGAAAANGAYLAWPLSESSGPTAADVSGNGRSGTYSSRGVTYGQAGPCLLDRNAGRPSTAVSLTAGSTSFTSGSVSSTLAIPASSALSLAVWFRAAAGSPGGTLMSVTQSTNVTTMALALTGTGALVLGVTTGSASTVTTSGADLRDGSWHLAVGTVGAAGMRVSVDAAAAVSNGKATGASSVAGTLRVGFGNHASLSTGTADSFTGAVAFAQLYTTQLSAAAVTGMYGAASG